MGIFTDDDEVIDNNTDVQTSHTFKTRDELKTSLIFNKDEAIENIANFISGKAWSVDYFLQIRDLNDNVGKPDVNKSPAIQKYNRINNLELILQTPIQQDDFENMSGDAVINAGFMPNIGDAFKASMLGGREIIFTIETVEKKNYNLRDTYFVSFKIFSTVDEEEIIYNDILLKVIKEYVYDKEHLLDYCAPVILASDYKNKLNLKKELNTLINYYIITFINADKNIFSIPTTTGTYIDTFLINFLYRVIEYSQYEKMEKANRVDTTNFQNVNYTVWDAIINRDPSLLPLCNKDIKFKFTPNTSAYTISRHLSFLDINYIVGVSKDPITVPLVDIRIDKEKTVDIPISVNADNTYSYIFSNNFYGNKNLTELSYVESLLLDFLNGKMLDMSLISKCVEDYKYWKTEDQFYLIPILIILVKDSINNTFVSI